MGIFIRVTTSAVIAPIVQYYRQQAGMDGVWFSIICFSFIQGAVLTGVNTLFIGHYSIEKVSHLDFI
jgi:uncharacterized membrane protein YoaK (UPF0700 family)